MLLVHLLAMTFSCGHQQVGKSVVAYFVVLGAL